MRGADVDIAELDRAAGIRSFEAECSVNREVSLMNC
jgi:hypothetical protein